MTVTVKARFGRNPLLTSLVVLLFISGCGDNSSQTNDSTNIAKTPPVYRLQTATIRQRSLPTYYSAPGTVIAKDQLQISSRITGYIDRVNVSEGDYIQPGDPLVEIDGTQVEAAIKGAKAASLSARAELQDAREDIKRYLALSETKALAVEQLQNAKFRQQKAEAALAQTEAILEAREQDRRSINLNSPVQAWVRERLRDPGDLALAGEPILRLDILATMELEIFLSPAQIGSIEIGQLIQVSVPTKQTLILAEIKRIVRFADPITRRSKVLIGVPNDIGLLPGQFARAEIPLEPIVTLVVPNHAMTTRAGIPGVFTVDHKNIVRFRSIRTGRASGDVQQVLSGLKPGWTVVMHPPTQLKDGDTAQVKAFDKDSERSALSND